MSEHKPKRKLQNNSEDDEEDYIEEDENDEFNHNKFLDDEALEDDEEESEDQQMSAKEKKELEEQKKRFEKTGKAGDEFARKLQDENYVKELQARAEFEEQYENYEPLDYQEQELPEKPIDAFGVYMVRCRQGKERDIAMRIMKVWLNQLDHPMHMFSVFVPEEKKGVIFVEVLDERKFVDAVDGVRDIYVNSIKKLDEKQMRELMIARVPSKIEDNSYVMIDNGVYKGDVGIVLRQLDQRNVKVKLVPRFDIESYLKLAEIERLKERLADNVDDDEREQLEKKIANKRKERQHMTENKTRQLFIPQELNIIDAVKVEEDLDNNEIIYKFAQQTFYDGFIHKDFRINQLKFNDIKPSPEDIKFFSGGDELFAKAQMRSQRTLEIKKGDKIRIISQNEKVFGKRTFIYAVERSMNQMIMDGEDHSLYTVYGLDLEEMLILKRDEFELYYEINDRVKIIEGTYEGETGIIEKINEEEQTIIFRRDKTETYITISLMDIELTEETNMKIQQLGDYRINDYVLLNEGVGIIMNILFDSNLLEVWTDQNKKIEVDLTQIQGIVNERKDHKTKDKNKQMIMKGEIVRIASGMYAGREAEILHIHDFTKVFVKIPGILENKGIVVVQSNMIQKKISQTRGNATEYFGRKEREIKREREREDEFNKPSGKSLDQLKTGTLITLTKKGFKNYTGKIMKKVGDKYEVLVISTNKKMKFTRNEFVLKNEVKREQEEDDSYLTQTPGRSHDSMSSFESMKIATPMTTRPHDVNRIPGGYPPATPSGQYHQGYGQYQPPQTPYGQYNKDFQVTTPMNQYSYGQYPPPTPANH